jgi:heterodisulfide reductase subunit A
VLSQSDFRAAAGKGDLPGKRIVMLQCVGARDAEHPYCSRFCCRQALSNALLCKSNRADAEITILHRGIRVFGFEEETFTEAMEQGISFIEIEGRPDVRVDGSVKVMARSIDGKHVEIDCDAVVLSLAHLHGESQEEISRITGAALDDLRFFASGDSMADPFTTSAEGVFVCGFCRGPVAAEDAFVEGVGAAGAICRALGS